MSKKRKQYSAVFKAQVALTALKEQKTLNEIAVEFDVQPAQVSLWKKEAEQNLAQLFEDKRTKKKKQETSVAREAELYQQIGQL